MLFTGCQSEYEEIYSNLIEYCQYRGYKYFYPSDNALSANHDACYNNSLTYEKFDHTGYSIFKNAKHGKEDMIKPDWIPVIVAK